jgi:hypothetical protein
VPKSHSISGSLSACGGQFAFLEQNPEQRADVVGLRDFACGAMEENMIRHITFKQAIATLMFAAIALPTGGAIAQQKQHVSYKSPAENAKYTQQTIIDVGDVPGHQVRLFEIHRTYPANQPVVNGTKLVEQWTRGSSDYIDNNGTSVTYGIYVFDNGDKFFTRSSLVAQSPAPGKLTNSVVGTITGGTGKLVGMQGVVRSTGSAEPKAGVNETQTDIDYWFNK